MGVKVVAVIQEDNNELLRSWENMLPTQLSHACPCLSKWVTNPKVTYCPGRGRMEVFVGGDKRDWDEEAVRVHDVPYRTVK